MAVPSGDALASGVLAGDARALAGAISFVENEAPAGVELVRALHGRAGRSLVVGVTGPPGAGKSTLVDRLTVEARRAGHRVGIVAVDPTSPFTGGAVLGDRVRMGRHASDRDVFIRSMATRGHLGGLSRAAGDVAAILEAAGKDVVFIETVGVGQDEVDVARTADVALVVLVPGAGDDIQALKAGIMEIADIFVVNKADREGADALVEAIASNLGLHPYAAGEWKPPIARTVATTGDGVADLWGLVGRFTTEEAARAESRRRRRYEHQLRDVLGQRFLRHVDRALPAGELERTAARIERREIDVYSAADELLDRAVAYGGARESSPGRA